MYLTAQQRLYHYCQVHETEDCNPNRRKAYRRVVTYLIDNNPSVPNILARLRTLAGDCQSLVTHTWQSGCIDTSVGLKYSAQADVFGELADIVKEERDNWEAEEWARLRAQTQIAGTPLALLVTDIQKITNLSSVITLEACYELTIKSGEVGVFATLQELLCLLKSGKHEQHSLVVKFWKSVKQAIQTLAEQQQEEVSV